MKISQLARSIAMLMIAVLLTNNFAVASRPIDPVRIKAKVQARGVGQGVRVTMADKTETKGVIVNIGDQAFTVKPKGAAEAQEFQYAQVTGIHNDKMGTGTKVIIVVAIAAVAIGITAIVIDHEINDGLKNITLCPNNECN
jgi:hypothetical protein